MSIVVGLAEIVIWTHDMARSLAFYGDLFGLEVISKPEVPARFLSTGEISGGVPAMIVLSPHPDGAAGAFPAAKRERVLHHLAFKVAPDRYEELSRRCAEAGLEVRGGIHPVLPGVRTFYVDDPEGNEVECISADLTPSPKPTLTRKEQAIAELFVGGQTVHEIAKGAGLATRGVERTLERVAEKLQLPNREDLSFLARSAPGEITRSRQALGRALGVRDA